jgi:hypothetical protein
MRACSIADKGKNGQRNKNVVDILMPLEGIGGRYNDERHSG